MPSLVAEVRRLSRQSSEAVHRTDRRLLSPRQVESIVLATIDEHADDYQSSNGSRSRWRSRPSTPRP